MAKQKRSQQTWWPLYVLVLIMAGLLSLTHRVAPSPGWRIFLEVGVVVIGYSLMTLWLETHSPALLARPSAEANSPTIKSPELEMPSPLSSNDVQRQLYTNSDPVIIYDGPEHSTSHPRSNGHHLARTTPYLPEEAAE